MPPMKGPFSSLDRSRDELTKAWLVRLIERASLEEIRDLPTERIARELPELISGLVSAVEPNGGGPPELSDHHVERAAALVQLRGGREASAGEVARDVAALQSVLLRALREEVGESDPGLFADTSERLAEATGVIQAAAVEEVVRSRARELESHAYTDALTGLHNLRYLQQQIAQLLDVHRRYDEPFAVLLMDIDGLKRVNDAHGHQAGDRVLMQVAMSMRRSIRSVDTAARLGGDEFCVLAPHQDAGSAVALAGRLAAAAQAEVATPDLPPVGLSIGVAACPEHADAADTLIDLADRAMYRAKASGDGVAVGETNGSRPTEGAAPRA